MSGKGLRKSRTRAKIAGSTLPRLTVWRSNKYVYAQIVTAGDGRSLAGCRGTDPKEVGRAIAQKAAGLKVTKVVFDRGPYKYHGRVKRLAEAAKEGGLVF